MVSPRQLLQPTQGKVDPLIGLKENVIIGKLIPAGTGMKRYRNTALNTDANFKDPEKLILKKRRRDFDDEFITEDDDIDLVDVEVVVSDDEE